MSILFAKKFWDAGDLRKGPGTFPEGFGLPSQLFQRILAQRVPQSPQPGKFGGVFGAVAETVAKRRPVPMEQVALEDTFGESGNGALLLEKYGLTAERIVSRARAAIARKG